MRRASRRPRPRLRSAGLTLVLALAACTGGSTSSSTGTPPSGPSAPVRLKVMVFNIEYGGEGIDFGKVVEAVRASDADVVGIEEAWGNIPRLARELGWEHYDVRTQIVSRYPLVDPPGGDGRYTFVEVKPGRVVAIGNVHLPSAPYGPHLVRKGATAEDVLAVERKVRVPAVEPPLEAIRSLAGEGVPAFLVGDFNTPSYRDWTQATVGARPQLTFPLDWPVSEAVEAAGFHDSYRDVYPDPLEHPGLTWPAARPDIPGSWNPGPNSAHDRIDFVYAAGPATTLASVIVGETGGPEVGIGVSPWPSDHRAVVSTFDVEPAVPPILVAVDRRLVSVSDDVNVTFHAPGKAGERVIVLPAGGDPSAAVAERPTGDGPPTDGTVAFPTDGWEPGAYEAALVDAAGAVLARIPLWVQEPGGRPQIGTSGPTFGVGEPIGVEWHGAPGDRWDWVGIYRRGADPNVASYLIWLYTDATIEGSIVLDADAHGRWPLEPGRYSMYLLEDDAYRTLASGTFTVRG